MWVLRKNRNLSDRSIKYYESNYITEEEKQKEKTENDYKHESNMEWDWKLM